MDFTEMDFSILEYTRFLSSIYSVDKIYFVHVVKEVESFSYLPEEYLDFRHQVTEDQRLSLEFRVEKHFKDAKIPYDCRIVSGVPFEEIIDLVRVKSADLVIAGKKNSSRRSGIVSDRLSRNLPCDFLLLPKKPENQLNNILVTTDFSEHSTLGMQRAIELKRQHEKITLFAHHIYDVPAGHSKSGMKYEAFADVVRESAEKEMSKWLSLFRPKIQPILTLKSIDGLADQVLSIAEKRAADMIIVGSKGQSKDSFALMGSNAIKILWASQHIPILIVKRGGENSQLRKHS